MVRFFVHEVKVRFFVLTITEVEPYTMNLTVR